MFDLTKFLPLWEKCEELRPTCDGERCVVLTDADGKSMGLFQEPDDNGTGYGHPIPDDVAAALIRDSAILVGGKKWGLSLVHLPLGVWRVDKTKSGRRIEVACHEDPTEALYLALCAVLGHAAEVASDA